jgi:hypothetical protein
MVSDPKGKIHTVTVFENRVPKRILGSEGEKVAVG